MAVNRCKLNPCCGDMAYCTPPPQQQKGGQSAPEGPHPISSYLAALPVDDLVERGMNAVVVGRGRNVIDGEATSLIRDLATALIASREEVERLTHAEAHWRTKCQATRSIEIEQRARAEAAEAKVAELLEVVDVFAAAQDRVDHNGHPDTAGFIGAGLTLGDLRRARAAAIRVRGE